MGKPNLNLLLVVGVVCLVFGCCAPACGSSSDWLETWVYATDVIALGTIAEVDTLTGWLSNRRQFYTLATLAVDEYAKGSSDARALTFRIGGHLVEPALGSRERLPVALAVGDTVFVFLKIDGDGRLDCHSQYAELMDSVAYMRYHESMDAREMYESVEEIVASRTLVAITRRADLVLVGDVAFIEELEHWLDLVTVRVSDVWKGSVDANLVEVEVGSTVQGRSNDVPVMTRGESVLVFLEEAPAGRFRIVGGRDGVYLLRLAASPPAIRTPRRHPDIAVSMNVASKCTEYATETPLELSHLRSTVINAR